MCPQNNDKINRNSHNSTMDFLRKKVCALAKNKTKKTIRETKFYYIRNESEGVSLSYMELHTVCGVEQT